jgi:hypothetical protein
LLQFQRSSLFGRLRRPHILLASQTCFRSAIFWEFSISINIIQY